MVMGNKAKKPDVEPLRLISWGDLVVGDQLGEGSFASVFRIERVHSPLLNNVDNNKKKASYDNGDSTFGENDSVSVTEMSTTADSFMDDLTYDTNITNSLWNSAGRKNEYVIKCARGPPINTSNPDPQSPAMALLNEASILNALPKHPNITKLVGVSGGVFGSRANFRIFGV